MQDFFKIVDHTPTDIPMMLNPTPSTFGLGLWGFFCIKTKEPRQFLIFFFTIFYFKILHIHTHRYTSYHLINRILYKKLLVDSFIKMNEV